MTFLSRKKLHQKCLNTSFLPRGIVYSCLCIIQAAFFNQNQTTMHKKQINPTLVSQLMVTLTLALSILFITGCGGIDNQYRTTLKTLSLRNNALRSSQRINQLNIDAPEDKFYIYDLRQAACKGDIDEVKNLCNLHKHGINEPITETGERLFHIAVDNADMNLIKWLLHCKDININCQKNDGHTPLHRAAYTGRLKIVEKLLRYPNIDWHIKTKRISCIPEHTALELAHLGLEHLNARLKLTTLDNKNTNELVKEINRQKKVITILERLG